MYNFCMCASEVVEYIFIRAAAIAAARNSIIRSR